MRDGRGIFVGCWLGQLAIEYCLIGTQGNGRGGAPEGSTEYQQKESNDRLRSHTETPWFGGLY
jgi:hypothetical protein